MSDGESKLKILKMSKFMQKYLSVFDSEDLANTAQAFQLTSVPRGSRLFDCADRIQDFYLIVEGSVGIYKAAESDSNNLVLCDRQEVKTRE